MQTNFRNRQASQHSFAMTPRADIPRSRYNLQQNRKSAFNAGYLVPVYCEEILPGDSFQGNSTFFARATTPIHPVMDDAELETFFFFVPNRLLWDQWEEFIAGGNFTVPQIVFGSTEAAFFVVNTLADHMGLPIYEQLATPTDFIQVNALPFRAYNLIFNEWFRDQNLSAPATFVTSNGPDPAAYYNLQRRAKKHDYFTSALPWAQKTQPVSMFGAGAQAPVYSGVANNPQPGAIVATSWVDGSWNPPGAGALGIDAAGYSVFGGAAPGVPQVAVGNLYADLAASTFTTINALRLAIQTQRLLERDARGGSRYVEQLMAHFGVRPPDFRLQRPEYIGGGRTPISHSAIATTAAGAEPVGELGAITYAAGSGHRFSYNATEHGWIIGLANIRTNLSYSQGLRRHWSRRTRFDYYFPVFAHLGEQPILNKEIFSQGQAAADDQPFGYQERWAEYRYTPNENVSYMRAGITDTLDTWHYGEEFIGLPALNNAFIRDPSESTVARSLAITASNVPQFRVDVLHEVRATRPMPTYSVPGLADHF